MFDSVNNSERTHFDTPLWSSKLYSIALLEARRSLECAIRQICSWCTRHRAFALQLERTPASISALTGFADANACFKLTISCWRVVL
jgi:hypothetical protein